MSININCKKKWHPSRYETRKQVDEVKKKLEEKESQNTERFEENRRIILEDKHSSKNTRMEWML